MSQETVIQTGKVYYANDARRDYRIAIKGCVVLPTVETVAKAYIINDNEQGRKKPKLHALSIILEKREGCHPVQFFTSEASDISKLLKDYGIKQPKGIHAIPKLEGKKIGVYVCHHTIAAVSPVVEQARTKKK